jgi:hypothetical protein
LASLGHVSRGGALPYTERLKKALDVKAALALTGHDLTGHDLMATAFAHPIPEEDEAYCELSDLDIGAPPPANGTADRVDEEEADEDYDEADEDFDEDFDEDDEVEDDDEEDEEDDEEDDDEEDDDEEDDDDEDSGEKTARAMLLTLRRMDRVLGRLTYAAAFLAVGAALWSAVVMVDGLWFSRVAWQQQHHQPHQPQYVDWTRV